MSTDRDVTRIVRSWLHEDGYEDADRILNLVLDEIDTTPQRRAAWLARRFPPMNSNFVRVALVAAAVVVIAVVGFQFLGNANTGGPDATGTPLPSASLSPSTPAVPSGSPPPLAVGSFISHGGQIQLDADGDGPNVTGSMTYTDVGGAELGGFVVDLVCTRATDGGLVLIAGPITDSTEGYVESAPTGTNVALILQRGSPVEAEILVEHPDPHEPSCPAFLESIPDERPPGALEPIEGGSIELRP